MSSEALDEPELDYDPGDASGGSDTVVLIAVIAVLAGAVAAWIAFDVPGWWSGETDIWGEPRLEAYIQTREVGDHSYRRIHAELFPQWLVAAGQGPAAWRTDRARRAFERFWNGIPDERLRGVGREIWQYVAARDFERGLPELKALADRWNRRLTEIERPYFLRLGVSGTRKAPFVFGGFYRRLAEPELRVGDEGYRTLILRRVDRTNLREMYLGATRKDATYAFVIVDRIRDFVDESVLPVVAARAEGTRAELDATMQAYGDRVRRALRRGLGRSQYRNLRRLAESHLAMANAVESIRSRRDCSDFRIAEPGWRGYPQKTIESLIRYARRDEGTACPSVKPAEARAIRRSVKTLRREGMRPAFEATLALFARGTAIHEVRHRVDRTRLESRNAGPACRGCERRRPPSVRSELSAYTASIAWSKHPVLPLFQACTARSEGAHGRAVTTLLERLDSSCEVEPPEKLGKRTREIESSLFAHAARIELPEDFPARVDLGDR